MTEPAGDPIVAKLVRAPGNDAPTCTLKVTTESAWFAARPSGTEDVHKINGESFKGAEHLTRVQEAAKQVVSNALNGSRFGAAHSRGLREGGLRSYERRPPCA